ncbi:hypothetical protein KR100_13750 [Synechococcus sp. KORDI-100]|nr:hypothetical protein KR100_13750 [Synechococcus sp. KORDI-100]
MISVLVSALGQFACRNQIFMKIMYYIVDLVFKI